MKHYRKIAVGAASCLLIALAVGSAGCGKQQSTPAPSDVRIEAKSSEEPAKKNIDNPKQVADHLETLAKGVQGVKNATCVVFGNHAIVGIDVEPTMERSEVGMLKYAVAEAFRKDPYGIDAVVTADIDLSQRIKEIGIDIRQGRAVSGFAEELADIVGRLVPQMPRDIMPPVAPEDLGTHSSTEQQLNRQ